MTTAGAVQTTVTANPVIGEPGLEYDAGYNDVVSFVAAEDMPFGVHVKLSGEKCYLPAAGADVTNFLGGLTLKDKSKATGVGYKAGDLVRVLRRGRAWALIEETIADTDAVYVRHTATAPEQKGALRNDVDTSDAAIPPGVKWFKGGTVAGGGAVIEYGVGGSAGATGATGATGGG